MTGPPTQAKVLGALLVAVGVLLAAVGLLMLDVVATLASVGWGTGDSTLPGVFIVLGILFGGLGVSVLTRRHA